MQQHIKSLLEHKNSKYFRVGFYAYTVLLFIATLLPLDTIRSSGDSWLSFLAFKNSDKIVHFILFFTLTGLLFIAYQSLKKNRYFLIPFLTGILIEILQHTLGGGRTFDVWDITANTLGTLTACLIFPKLLNSKN